MKTISKIAVLGAFAALAACSGGGEEANNADMNMTDMNAGMTDMNADMNMPADNMTLEANNVTVVENTGDAGATDANAATNNTM